MSERIYLYDTTLRDGGQTQGVDFTAADKVAIAAMLDHLGVDYVEGGWPGANPTDDGFFANPPPFAHAKLCAFGMTRRAGRSAGNDPGLAALLQSQVDVVTLVGKSSARQVELALGVPLDENLRMIEESIAEAARRVPEVMFDAEHFFDGYLADADYALACLDAAKRGGARWIVLCDTNGGRLPHEIARVVERVAALVPPDALGIHTHDDTENAVAGTLAAVRAGARQVQGTLNGLGERCGNANLVALIPTLMLKMGYRTGVTEDGLRHLTALSRALDERLNRIPTATPPTSARTRSPTRPACTPRRSPRTRAATSTSPPRWSATGVTSRSRTRRAAPICSRASARSAWRHRARRGSASCSAR